jgi:hypothetical protein
VVKKENKDFVNFFKNFDLLNFRKQRTELFFNALEFMHNIVFISAFLAAPIPLPLGILTEKIKDINYHK